jgi:hypothetical protein
VKSPEYTIVYKNHGTPNLRTQPGMVVDTCNPSYLGVRDRKIVIKMNLCKVIKTLSQKTSLPIISALQEA